MAISNIATDDELPQEWKLLQEYHATRAELEQAYMSFNRAIDRLSSVLDDYSRRQEKMNDRLENKIKELEKEWDIDIGTVQSRLSALELERNTRETKQGLILKFFQIAPKMCAIVIFVFCAGVVKIVEEFNVQRAIVTEERKLDVL